ncbi:glucose-6-phosphate isomerase [uncultured Helicobacter sp.]|uniref:glucose-6-phosphate isomerase n=1 Tax=uncultured Helicobacter sp. TaxID=175537 RepID=UPI0027DD4231|nr:glucose-6-phosphate isomerase [uncultured Helicobacter sp.]
MLKFTSCFDTQSSFIYPDKSDLDSVFEAITHERDERKSGYYHLPFEDRAIKDSALLLAQNPAFLEIKNLIIVGIGGSSLGLRAIDSALSHLPNRKNIYLQFLEHTDPVHSHKVLDTLNIKETLFIVISKSGTTIETSSLFKYIVARFSLFDINASHLACITDEDSPLFHLAKSKNIPVICIDKNVGGRFSVLSSVGILPLMILGFDTQRILNGAKAFVEGFFARKHDHLLHKAFFLAKNYQTLPINVLFSYSSVFRDFNLWYVQLWAESLGKLNAHNQKVGLTPLALIGSIDQHSSLQLIVQGVMNKSVTFLTINQQCFLEPKIPDISLPYLESSDFVNATSFLTLLNLQQKATMETLKAEGIPTDLITLESLDEASVGALIMYFELLTSCAGAVFGINTYDQPGVEFGKKRLREMF